MEVRIAEVEAVVLLVMKEQRLVNIPACLNTECMCNIFQCCL